MNIVVITQDDPFYLGKNLDYLFSNLPEGSQVVGCVVAAVSPFGKKESLVKKAQKTHKIFGASFFARYCVKFAKSKLNTRYRVNTILRKHEIPQIQLESSINSEASLALIGNYKPDLLISIAGNEIFKLPLITLAPQGCLNLHTALLPKYRGLMPSFWALKNQETQTGVSVFFVDEGIDSGPIHVQKTIDIAGLSLEDLILKSKHLGMQAIIESVSKLLQGNRETLPNNEDKKTYFGFPTANDVAEFRAAGARFY